MRFNRCAILTEGGRSAVGETQTSLRVTQPSRGLHRSLTRLQKNTFVSVAHSVTYHDLSLTSDSNARAGKMCWCRRRVLAGRVENPLLTGLRCGAQCFRT